MISSPRSTLLLPVVTAVLVVGLLAGWGWRWIFSCGLPEAASVRSERTEPGGGLRGRPAAPRVGVASPRAPDSRPASRPAANAAQPASRPAEAAGDSVPDDGRTMWISPTSGPPLDVAFVPAGAQLIFVARPAELSQLVDADQLQFVFGPWAADWQGWFGRIVPGGLKQVDQLTASFFPDAESDDVHVAFILRLAKPTPRADARAQLPREFAVPAPPYWSGHQTNWLAGRPADAAEGLLVVAASRQCDELLASEGVTPPLRREMEQLVAASDARRLINILFTPNFLAGHRDTLLTGKAALLADPAIALLGERVQAALVSLHEKHAFFVELRAACPTDQMPSDLAQQINGRLAQLAYQVRRIVTAIDPHPYGRRIVTRFPRMFELLATYTRHGAQGHDALLRCYLPARAAHNLALAARLLLDEPALRTDRPVDRPIERAVRVADRLRQRASLSFRRDTLENALHALGEAIGVKIEIMGRDLQLGGITRNQSFGIDLRNRPAEEILQRIVRLANPDPSADGLADPRQSLVYVIGAESPGRTIQDPTGHRFTPSEPAETATGTISKKIYVTTRRQAQQRGDPLPSVFLPSDHRSESSVP